MYQATEDGKNNFQFYSEKLNANSLERLSDCADHGSLTQAIIAMGSGRSRHSRWRNFLVWVNVYSFGADFVF